MVQICNEANLILGTNFVGTGTVGWKTPIRPGGTSPIGTLLLEVLLLPFISKTFVLLQFINSFTQPFCTLSLPTNFYLVALCHECSCLRVTNMRATCAATRGPYFLHLCVLTPFRGFGFDPC